VWGGPAPRPGRLQNRLRDCGGWWPTTCRRFFGLRHSLLWAAPPRGGILDLPTSRRLCAPDPAGPAGPARAAHRLLAGGRPKSMKTKLATRSEKVTANPLCAAEVPSFLYLSPPSTPAPSSSSAVRPRQGGQPWGRPVVARRADQRRPRRVDCRVPQPPPPAPFPARSQPSHQGTVCRPRAGLRGWDPTLWVLKSSFVYDLASSVSSTPSAIDEPNCGSAR